MSERLDNVPLSEILRPDVTPEMGFQSYDMLADNKETRDQQEIAFLNGDIIRPILEYPQIDQKILNQGIRNLNAVGLLSSEIADEEYSTAVWNSAGYRLAEMYWLKQAKKLDRFRGNPTSNNFELSAQRYQDLNEQLYGTPDKELTASIIGEVFAQAESMQLDITGLRILDELKHGIELNIAGEHINMRGLAGMEKGRLPEIGNKLRFLREVIEEEFAPIYKLVGNYWEEIVLPRASKNTLEPQFEVTDMVELFKRMRDSIDPENSAKISVVLLEKGTSLSWDTPTMSVRIGAGRKPVTDQGEMIGHLIHELGVHGGRAVHGLNTDMPVLGTGLFTNAQEGEQADYLTFEEGFASLINSMLDSKSSTWQSLHISHYLNTALAYEGADFREAFEITWRARTLMAAPDGKPLTEDIIKKQREQAYISMVRTRRGTPTEIAHRHPLTFNKDLAYLQGKIIALQFLDEVGNNKNAIKQVLKGKFDPLNKAQKRLADRYIPLE